MLNLIELLQLGFVRSKRDTSGTTLIGPDGKPISQNVQNDRKDNPILVVGGDHPYAQWYGAKNNGMSSMYLSRGIKPYLAINTAPGTLCPGANADTMKWAQLKELRAAGVDVIAHGHRHIQQWDRINTGINIGYSGTAATATVQMTGTTLVGVANGSGVDPESFSFDVAQPQYSTLSTLAAAVAAVGGGKWTCTLAPELTGAEAAAKILTFATPVSAKGTTVKLAAGGGLLVQYTGTVYEQVTVSLTATLSIWADGVLIANFSLTNGAYNTLSKLVAAINALTGFTASLMDNGYTVSNGFETYVSGNEASTNLQLMTQVPCISVPITIEAGLSSFYMRDRQFQACVDGAAANGVSLTNFAQSGQGLQAWHVGGHQQFKNMRGNPNVARSVKPFAIPARLVDSAFRIHKAITLADYTIPGRTKAVVDALVDSGPFYVDMLMHKVIPDGSSGLSLATTTTADADQVEGDWVQLLDYVKAAVDAQTLDQMTPDQVRTIAQTRAKPKNLLFNPRFRNSGESLYVTGGATNGLIVPGWQTLTSLANCSAMSASNGVISVSSNTGTQFTPLLAEVILEPGKSYEVAIYVDVQSYSSGTGVSLSVGRRRGKFKQTSGPAIAGFNSESVAQSRMLRYVVTVPNRDPFAPACVKSINAQPWDLSAAKNIKLNIDAKGAIDNLDCSAGAVTPTAVTAKEIAAAINAAIASNVAYAALPEYHTCAKAVGGKVVIQSPYHQLDATYTVRIDPATTASATTAIFGGVAGGTHYGVAQPEQIAGAEDFLMTFSVNIAMVGTVALSNPFIREIAYQM